MSERRQFNPPEAEILEERIARNNASGTSRPTPIQRQLTVLRRRHPAPRREPVEFFPARHPDNPPLTGYER